MTKKRAFLLLLVLMMLTLSACTAAERAKYDGYGNSHCVIQYSGGKLMGLYVSEGKVLSESDSDGYYFQDRETGLLHELSGEVTIITLADGAAKANQTPFEICSPYAFSNLPEAARQRLLAEFNGVE